MNAVDVVRYGVRRAHAWLESIVDDVSPSQASWRPPGTANSIAVTYAHIMINADVDLNRFFHDRPSLLAGEWGERLGRSELAPEEVAPDAEFDWTFLRGYGREVHNSMKSLADALTSADLERSFQMMPAHHGIWQGIDIYTLHGGSHVWMHGGEIACLKGLQGSQGYRNFGSLYMEPNKGAEP